LLYCHFANDRNYGYCSRSPGSPDWTQHAYITEDFYGAAAAVNYYLATEEGIAFDDDGNLVVPEGMIDLVAALVPKNVTEFGELTDGVTDMNELVRRIALNSLNRRTPEWIKENGFCMDNLLAKKSTLPHAGQGGFAQRSIREGEMVAPAFLMQIIDKDALILYDDDGAPFSHQLLLN